MAITNLNIEIMESSEPGDSKVGSCSEAPHTGTAGQHLDEQSASGTPLIGGELTPASDLSLENLDGLTESRHSRPPNHQEEKMWCCQEADEEGQARGGSHWGLCWGPTSVRYRWSATDPTGAQYIRGSTWTRTSSLEIISGFGWV
jgi:hypothetical protein